MRSAGIDPATLDVTIPQRRLVAFLADRGVPALDLLLAFERAARDRDPDGSYPNNDTHWSVSGNEMAARRARAGSSPISSPPSTASAVAARLHLIDAPLHAQPGDVLTPCCGARPDRRTTTASPGR